MCASAIRYPLDMISIELESDRSASALANDDVAFVLVSRFNVRMQVTKHPRWSHLEGRHLSESADYERFWLNRLDLFERCCIPSVVNLAPLPDAWFVAFGDMESWFVRELLDRLRPYPWIRPYFRSKGHPDDAGPLSELLSGFVRSLGKPWLCSTRFDSDDSLHRQFIEALDRAITQLRERGYADERRCLNFPYGLLRSGDELSVFLRRHNMFLSIFEPVGEIRGPYDGGHDEVRERMPLVEIVTNLPMWIYHRHEETLEPTWAVGLDRLTVADSDRYLPSFGLPLDRSNTAVDRMTARELSACPYWDARHFDRAVQLAAANNQPNLACWLDSRKSDPVDLVRVAQEIEGTERCLLNGAQLARFARELDADGESSLALRVFDYAVFAAPLDRHVRRERDALADDIASILDFDEQMDILDVATPPEVRSNAVVFVVSCLLGADACVALAHAEYLQATGFPVTVMLALGADQMAPEISEGVSVEVLHVELPNCDGRPAPHRQALRLLARRVSEMGPSLLIADESPDSQRLAASVGRALGIPVEFGRWSG